MTAGLFLLAYLIFTLHLQYFYIIINQRLIKPLNKRGRRHDNLLFILQKRMQDSY